MGSTIEKFRAGEIFFASLPQSDLLLFAFEE